MQKITKEQMLTELMVKLETIDGKLDKLLTPQVQSALTGNAYLAYRVNYRKPPRWSNESYTGYLKRIGEFNVAQSDEEIFREECK